MQLPFTESFLKRIPTVSHNDNNTILACSLETTSQGVVTEFPYPLFATGWDKNGD